MTKLEELLALMVNEMEDFKNSVDKLEKINEQLTSTKLKIDLKDYRFIIEKHQQKMQSYVNRVENFENRLDEKLRNAKIYPNWAVLVFIVSLLLSLGAIMFSIYQF